MVNKTKLFLTNPSFYFSALALVGCNKAASQLDIRNKAAQRIEASTSGKDVAKANADKIKEGNVFILTLNATYTTSVKGIKDFFVLGDSISDNGAFISILSDLVRKVSFQEPFYQGRSFGNGPMAAEIVAKALGCRSKAGWYVRVPWKKSKQPGTNYAVANAGAATMSPEEATYIHKFFDKFKLRNQLKALIGDNPSMGSDDIVMIMIGGNDVMSACDLDASAEDEKINDAVNEIHKTLIALANCGVRRIIASNVPNIGLIPAFLDKEMRSEKATQSTQKFNKVLKDKVHSFQKSYPGILKVLDLNALFEEIIREYQVKASEGYDCTHACITDIADQAHYLKNWPAILLKGIFLGKLPSSYISPGSRENIDKYLFLDYYHPTKQAHKEIADQIITLIQEFQSK